MKIRALIAALSLVLLHASARADEVDPRELHAQHKFAAAGAGFERRWNATGDPTDGINAAISFRAAGNYAHARVVLARVLKSKLDPDLAVRARLLDDKLAALTATVRVELPTEKGKPILKANGEAAERIGDSFVVEVGRADLAILVEGCDAWSWKGELAPGQELVLAPQLKCPQGPGSLHVSMGVTSGADVTVDGATRAISFDANYSLKPGRHTLSVSRKGLVLVDHDDVEVRPGDVTQYAVPVPVRAQESAFLFGVGGATLAGSTGSTAAVGVLLGYTGIAEYAFLIGTAGSTVDPGSGRMILLGIDMGARRLLDPWVNRSAFGGRFLLEFMPGMVHADLAGRGLRRSEERAILFDGFVLPLRLTAAWGATSAELTVFPGGVSFFGISPPSSYSYSETKWGYAAGATLTIARGFLGN